VLITATGCSSQLKDYAHQFACDPSGNRAAAKIRCGARDFAELCTPFAVTPPHGCGLAYHPACSLQNSLEAERGGEALLEAAGFMVNPFAESHLCCGSPAPIPSCSPELSGSYARPLAIFRRRARRDGQPGNNGCLLPSGGGRRT